MVHFDVRNLGEFKEKLNKNGVQQEEIIMPKAWVVYLCSELEMMQSSSILLATNYGAVNAKTINIFTPVTA